MISPGPVAQELARRLTETLAPTSLTVSDDSAQHRGHGGYREGIETHLSVEIVSAAFAGMTRLARQRAVLAAAAELMDNPIHALAIRARAPGEA
jgi:BolA family transcriptional regulator, general stress-responsive regulator